MKKIVSWIEHEGVEGYLVWEGEDMVIQLNDPDEKKDERKRQRTETEARKQEKLSKKARTMPANCK